MIPDRARSHVAIRPNDPATEIAPRSQIPAEPFFSSRVKFFHRTARDYILSTRLQEIKSRTAGFDVNDGIIRLLLAEFKFAPARSDSPWSWHVGRSPLERHFHDTFVWMGAIHRKGHMIPSQYLEEFGKILDIQDMSAGGDLKLKQKVILTDRIVFESIVSERRHGNENGFSFSCWLMWLGLDECLEPEVLKSSMSESFHSSRHNVLLSASLFGRLAVVRKLLRE